MSDLISQRYPIGEQNFPNIRKSGKVYIDKTALIYKLTESYKYVFLSRPRRFGKSLLLSTIQAVFEGKKELFHGLAISNLKTNWKPHPVLHLEMSKCNPGDLLSLNSLLNEQFQIWEKEYNVDQIQETLGARFTRIIRKAVETTGEKVVILIDEYDNPLINTLQKENIHSLNKDLLKSIYSNIKAMDEYICFAMLTGVGRFSKTSIFSGMNNLADISFSDSYSSLCGFTESEIKENLWPGVMKLGKKMNISPEEALNRLKETYDGYHFSEECPDLYNPYSLLLALEEGKIKLYWIDTATPEFLAEKLKESSVPFSRIFNDKVRESSLTESDTAYTSPVSLLFQTGYLTIKSYDAKSQRYLLGIPNKEVEDGLFSYLLSQFVGMSVDISCEGAVEMVESLKNGEPEEFLKKIKTYISGIPYDIIPIINEKYFQHLFYLIFRIAGLDISVESKTSFSRSDLVVKTKRYIYIIELKVDGNVKKAMRQIEEKEYCLPYLNDTRKIYAIALNISSTTRNISQWLISDPQNNQK